mgnify:CR=1 FL=1
MDRTLLAALLVGSLALAACGEDAGSSTGSTTQGVVSTGSTTGSVDVPEAIVSLSPTHTEMLYALGAGGQVLAVDDTSNHPPEAATKMVGLDAYNPSVESIAGLEPDLVVIQGGYAELAGQLGELGIDVFVGEAPADLDGLYAQVEQLGERIGRPREAARLVDGMRSRVDAAIADLPELDEPLTYYHELDNTFFSVTSDTFIGAVYAELGLVNIADDGNADNPYPQLSSEFIIAADPDLIFLADTKYSNESAATVAARPGWDTIAAVVAGGIVELDDDVASRWGPRIADYIEQVGEAVGNVAALQAAG